MCADIIFSTMIDDGGVTMKKKLITLILCLTMVGMLCACDAEKVNDAIGAVREAAGVDLSEVKVEQEQLDALTDAAKQVGETAKDVAEDQAVRDAMSKLGDALADVIENSDDTAKEDIEPKNTKEE